LVDKDPFEYNQIVSATINGTVINPPIGKYGDMADLQEQDCFGWDSRGAFRSYGLGTGYTNTLAWNGNPIALKVGDAVTSAKSKTDPYLESGTPETCLEALAVLTVLDQIPESDTFRPGIYQADRSNVELFRYANIRSDIDSHLISWPTTKLHSGIGTMPTTSSISPDDNPFDAVALKTKLPGPWFAVGGSIYRSMWATYNGNTEGDPTCSAHGYRQKIAWDLGDLAVGSLAGWLDADTRRTCRIRFLQNAIDTYDSVKAGYTQAYNGGHCGGYATLFAVAGHMLNHQAMFDYSHTIGGESAVKRLAGLSQPYQFTENGAGALGKVLDFQAPEIGLNEENLQVVTDASANTVTLTNAYEWRAYRPGSNVQNMKLKITSGAGASSTQIYVVTVLEDLYTTNGVLIPTYDPGAANGWDRAFTHTDPACGGTLTVKPAWVNGEPNSTSKMTFSAFTSEDEDSNRWAFTSSRLYGYPLSAACEKTSASPFQDYCTLAMHAEQTLLVALYAMDAEGAYQAGFDKWLIETAQKPVDAMMKFSDSNCRSVAAPKEGSSGDSGRVLGGLLKEQVLGAVQFNTSESMDDLPAPGSGAKLWNE